MTSASLRSNLSWLQPGRQAVAEEPVHARETLSGARPEILQCYDYWVELRQARGHLPSHKDIRPNRIRALLSRFVLVELRPGGNWAPTYRLAGTEFERTAGRSLTGRRVADLFETDAFKRMNRVLAEIAADGVPRYQHARLMFRERDFVLVQRLFLPWSMVGDTADFIGGILVDTAGTGRLPAP